MELRQWSFADTLAVKDMAVTSLTFLTPLTSTLVKLQFFNKISDSAGIQTQDLQNRNLTLYSAKLRNHELLFCKSIEKKRNTQIIKTFSSAVCMVCYVKIALKRY